MSNECELDEDERDEEVRRIEKALADIQRKKRERIAFLMRERRFQGRSTDAYEDTYISEDESDAEPGSADDLAKKLMAVRERGRFNLQRLVDKYSNKERTDSDKIEFDVHGNIYFPENMPANQQQIHVDKMFRDDLNFGKGVISAPCNSEDVFRGDSRAWRESKKQDKMYEEFRRSRRRSFPQPIFEDEEVSRQIDRQRFLQRRPVKNEENEEDLDSEEGLSDEEFSDGNTSDDLSSEVFTSSEEEGDDEEVQKENDENHPTSSTSNHVDEIQPQRTVAIKKEKTTPKFSKKASLEKSETPQDNQIAKNSKNPENVMKNPKMEVGEQRNSPRSIKKESIKTDVTRTPITRRSSMKVKMEVEKELELKIETKPEIHLSTQNESPVKVQCSNDSVEVTSRNNESVDISTSSKQSDQDEKEVILIKSVKGTTSTKRRSQRNKKRTLDEHWIKPNIKKPKTDVETESITSIVVNLDDSDITDEKPGKASRRKSNRKTENEKKPVGEKIWDQEIDFSEFGNNKLFGLSTGYHSKLKITFFDHWNSTSRLIKPDPSDTFDADFRRYMSTHKKQRIDYKAGYDVK